jgi:imidazole glycerol-phosphate synthase subunit HisH
MKIRIIHYKAGNIASVNNALARLGHRPEPATDPADLATADKLIFPGVGHARPAMEVLNDSGLTDAIRNFRGPVLGICLGMQLMASRSEEGDTPGMGIFPEKIRLFVNDNGSPNLKIPHMGWNEAFGLRGPLFDGIPEGSHFYFIHSYYMEKSSQATALCHYGRDFTAALEMNNYFGVQFHPEKSGEAGMTLLKNFLAL